MNTSPITTWEGAEAYFTFGPGSVGVLISLFLAVVIVTLFIVYMIREENHLFAETNTYYPEMIKQLQGKSRNNR